MGLKGNKGTKRTEQALFKASVAGDVPKLRELLKDSPTIKSQLLSYPFAGAVAEGQLTAGVEHSIE